MYALLKLHHNCDECMGVQKQRKNTFLLRLNIGKKKLADSLLHNIDFAVVSECLCYLV